MSETRYIPNVNSKTPLGSDDIEYGVKEVPTHELTRRSQSMMADYRSVGPVYGIAAELDPADAVSGTSPGTPLQVDVNSGNPLILDVWPGLAFTQAGHFVELLTKQEGVALVIGTPAAATQYVIYVEYEVEDDVDTNVSVNYYNTTAARQTKRMDDADIVKVATYEDWQDVTIFTSDRMEHVVAICFVSAIDIGGVDPELSIDHTQSTLTINRPWFSPVDIAHRSEVGSGSTTVPHSLALSDLSEGALTLYEQMLKHGMVLSKDRAVPGCPGKLCQETITSSRVRSDNGLGPPPNGPAPAGSVTGVVNQRYVELLAYPIHIVGAKAVGDTSNDIAVTHIRGSNILLIPTDIAGDALAESIGSGAAGFLLYYTSANALEPPVSVVIRDEMVFGTPESEELVVAGGKAIPSFDSTTLAVGSVGPIPQRIRVFCDEDGDLVMAPQVLVCATVLEDIGLAVQAVTATMVGPAKIKVGLVEATWLGCVVETKISGTDLDGNAINESIIFRGNAAPETYDPIPVPTCTDADIVDHNNDADTYSGTPGHFIRTGQVFASVTSWQVISRSNDGTKSIVCIYADLDPASTTDLQAMCPVCDFVWNGEAVCLIRDIRPLVANFRQPWVNTQDEHDGVRSFTWYQQLSNPTYTYYILAAEHIMSPHWIDAQHEDAVLDWYAPELRSDHIPTNGEKLFTYVSRPIEIPIEYTSGKAGKVWLLIFRGHTSDKIEEDTTVYARVAPRSTPTLWGAWTAQVDMGSAAYEIGMYDIGIATADNLKIQLRIKGKIKGWALVGYHTP